MSLPISWIDSPSHWRWLASQTDGLLDFYAAGAADRERGGFWWVDTDGAPMPAQGKQLWINARLTYSFTLGTLLGRPGDAPLVEHGLAYLREGALRDRKQGGWFWAVDAGGVPSDSSKQAYGHAFVLIAAAAASIAGFDARDLFADALDVLEQRFWRDGDRMFVDVWDQGFDRLAPYRGQNANMHLVEALMLAHEVDGDAQHLERATSIARRLIRDVTAGNDWRLPEHFDEGWVFEPDYNSGDRDNLFRPYGSVVGHWLEWARLLLQLNASVGGQEAWVPGAAAALFDRGINDGWDAKRGGFVFSTDWAGRVVNADRYHWVITEAIGAAVALSRATGDARYAEWYQRFWDYARLHLIDPEGSWHHQLDSANAPVSTAWDGKPDLYHAIQATLFARVPLQGSIVGNLAAGRLEMTRGSGL